MFQPVKIWECNKQVSLQLKSNQLPEEPEIMNLRKINYRYNRIISDKSPSFIHRVYQIILWGISLFYGMIILIRRWIYDIGFLPTRRIQIPVLCVGNLTTGGTGKTPIVRYITEQFSKKGKKAAILTRGYKRVAMEEDPQQPLRVIYNELDSQSWTHIGDEPALLAQMLPNTPVFIHSDRYQSALAALKSDSPDVLIMDDGFSHRRFHRDMDLVLLDVTEPLGYGYLLPRGLLREPVSSLKRASAILLTRCEKGQSYQKIEGLLNKTGITCPVFRIIFQPGPLYALKESNSDSGTKGTDSLLAFCGIGNPHGFKKTLETASIAIGDMMIFPDHHTYTSADIAQLEELCQKKKAKGLVTTEKDGLKLKGLIDKSPFDWFCLPILAQPENESKFREFLMGENIHSDRNP